MSVGKYSPTVTDSYQMDQSWWERNGGGYGNGKFPDKVLDDDGYDSYGYSGDLGDGPDRAGNTEYDYLCGEWDDDFENYDHPLYNDVAYEWAGKKLGDLPQYVQCQDIPKLVGVSINTVIEHVILKKHADIRIIKSGYRFAIHKDDIDKVKNILGV